MQLNSDFAICGFRSKKQKGNRKVVYTCTKNVYPLAGTPLLHLSVWCLVPQILYHPMIFSHADKTKTPYNKQ